MLVVTIGVCVLIGVPVATALFGVLSGTPSLLLARDIAGVPVLVYAFMTGGPLAALAGLVGSKALNVLATSSRWPAGPSAWLLAGAGVGVLVGVTVAAALVALSGDSLTEARPRAFIEAVALTGAGCGCISGLVGWYRLAYGHRDKRAAEPAREADGE
jgi:hypothetical protein